MADFRKWLLAFGEVALLFGLGRSANAQVTNFGLNTPDAHGPDLALVNGVAASLNVPIVSNGEFLANEVYLVDNTIPNEALSQGVLSVRLPSTWVATAHTISNYGDFFALASKDPDKAVFDRLINVEGTLNGLEFAETNRISASGGRDVPIPIQPICFKWMLQRCALYHTPQTALPILPATAESKLKPRGTRWKAS